VNTQFKALLLLILAGAGLLRCLHFTKPFDNGLRGSCGAGYSVMADNHLRYGIATTALVPVMNARTVDREHLVYYEHHPPSMVALTALVFALTGGGSESSARLLPVLLSLSTLLGIFFLVRRTSGLFAAFTTAGLAASLPVSAYYGPFLNFESFVIPPVVLSLLLYTKWIDESRNRLPWGSLGFMAVGVLMDWIAGVAAVLMMLDGLLFGRASRPTSPATDSNTPARRDWKSFLMYPALAVLVFLAVQVWYGLQNQRFGSSADQGGSFLLHIIGVSPLARSFDFSTYLANLGRFSEDLFTWPVLGCSALGLLLLLWGMVKNRLFTLQVRAICILLSWGLINLVLFGNQVCTGHDFWIMLLYPGLCWCAALVAASLAGRGSGRASRRWAAGLAVLGVVALVGFGANRTVNLMETRRGNEDLYRLGEAYGRLAQEGELVFMPAVSSQVVYYSRGAVFPVSIGSPQDWRHNLPKIEQYGYGGLARIFAVPRNRAGEFQGAIDTFKKIAPLKERDDFIVVRF
jgi:4-amino-4-deoxy-L-arabinose transferase-like glycosyltransferase